MRAAVFALLVAAAAGCRFHVGAAANDGEPADLAVVAADDLASSADLAPPLDLSLPGLLAVVHSDIPATVNLSTEGTTDWAHFGLNAVADVNRKSGVTAAIALATTATATRWPSYSRSLSWTGGTPTASATTTSGIYLGTAGNAFTLTVPADTTTRTLSVYLTQYQSTAAIAAHLSDSSAADYGTSTSAGSNIYHRYTLTYRATHPGQTLRVTWTLMTDAGGGSVDVLAATLY